MRTIGKSMRIGGNAAAKARSADLLIRLLALAFISLCFLKLSATRAAALGPGAATGLLAQDEAATIHHHHMVRHQLPRGRATSNWSAKLRSSDGSYTHEDSSPGISAGLRSVLGSKSSHRDISSRQWLQHRFVAARRLCVSSKKPGLPGTPPFVHDR